MRGLGQHDRAERSVLVVEPGSELPGAGRELDDAVDLESAKPFMAAFSVMMDVTLIAG